MRHRQLFCGASVNVQGWCILTWNWTVPWNVPSLGLGKRLNNGAIEMPNIQWLFHCLSLIWQQTKEREKAKDGDMCWQEEDGPTTEDGNGKTWRNTSSSLNLLHCMSVDIDKKHRSLSTQTSKQRTIAACHKRKAAMRGACLWLAVLRTCAFPTLYKSNKGRHVCDLQLMCVVLSGVVCTGHRHAGKPSRFEIWQSSKWTLWTCCCLSNCPSLGLPEFWWILVSALFLVVAHRCNPLDFDWVLTSSHCDSHKAATDVGDQPVFITRRTLVCCRDCLMGFMLAQFASTHVTRQEMHTNERRILN